MYLLPRLRGLRCSTEAQGGALLRVLLLRVCPLSPDTSQSIVLPHAGQLMSSEVRDTTSDADWARGIRGCLTWGIPVAILLIAPVIGARYLVIVWPVVLALMGVPCLLNARRCGRIHCYFTGPFFLLLAGAALLYGLGVLPLGAKGWSMLSLALVIGSIALCCVPQ